ncbi:LysM peptidoglycan-binding domain-containing protein [Mobilicoccus pelagius]|uniref:LysM peptidoglycan-binding domain-containing protein n=1 Tax=Mobilicoccus pelagius TaxID=746032 RepID=UPI0002DBC2EA|nr:LysM peptidoglycan-binding domain-containing protein [Mobilicoccus pelagius]
MRTLAVFGALCLLALVAAARWASPDLPPTHSVTVRPGQTLLEIATEELPMVPTEAAALRIRLANGLNSSVVMAGQSLVIPGES